MPYSALRRQSINRDEFPSLKIDVSEVQVEERDEPAPVVLFAQSDRLVRQGSADEIRAAADVEMAAPVNREQVVVQRMPGALGLAWPPICRGRRNRAAIEDQLILRRTLKREIRSPLPAPALHERKRIVADIDRGAVMRK